jgi:hypothetical protein
MSGGHAIMEGGNKITAVVIALLAALLALVETGAKNAQDQATRQHIEAANLWAFFQAKTIRQTTLRTADELYALLASEPATDTRRDEIAKQRATWRATIARWESEPDVREGRKELIERAKAAEAARDRAVAQVHKFETASAALQLAIVLASASIVTGVAALFAIGVGLGGLATAVAALGWFAPGVHVLFF